MLMFKKYRKKPVVIQAAKLSEESQVETLEGVMKGNPGDYLILGIQNEPYFCKPDIFEKTYDEVKEQDPPNTLKVKLGYMCINNGDGSVSVQFYRNRREADLAEEYEAAMDSYEGWGENSASELKIEIDLKTGRIISGTEDMKYITAWVEQGKPRAQSTWDFQEKIDKMSKT